MFFKTKFNQFIKRLFLEGAQYSIHNIRPIYENRLVFSING